MNISAVASEIIPNLTKGEKRGIIDAVNNHRDKWGSRYLASVVRGRKDAICQVGNIKITWNHIAPGGFLSAIGGEVAKQLMGDL